MKIVVVDGHGLNPGDLSWQDFEQLGEMTYYDRTAPAEVVERVKDAEVVITNKVVFDRTLLKRLPNLRYIGVTATGYNIIDLVAAEEQGIVVTNIPTYGTDAVAQFTFALLLEICSQVGRHAAAVQEGVWEQSLDFTFWQKPLYELAGKTFGLVGYGRIAQATAKLARAFGMKVIFANHRPRPDARDTQVSFEELWRTADVISLHVPQTAETTKLIDTAVLAQMKPTAILLNTARGGLIDEQALADALNANQLRAAAVDVVTVEPIESDNPLLKAKNCYITPHIAWAPVETRERLMAIAVANLQQFQAGTPQNQVKPA